MTTDKSAKENKTPSVEEAQELVPATNVGEDSGKGQTTISEHVVAKVAGLAVRGIDGVYNLGNSAARAIGAIRSTVGLDDNITQGISVEVGQTQAAVDVNLIVEYPYPIHDVTNKVREAVISNVEGLVGLEVTEVNIKVSDVHTDSDDDEDETQERVK